MSSTAAPAGNLITQRMSLRRLIAQAGLLVIFTLLFVSLSIWVKYFLTVPNMLGLLLTVTTVGIIACTMLFCLAAGDVDLSVGSIVAMTGVVAAMVTNASGSAYLGFAAGVAAGSVAGILNGVCVALLGVNALIATLATMQIVRGVSFIASGGSSVGIVNTDFYTLGVSNILGLPTPIWFMIAAFIFFGLLLRRTIFGRNTLAIGGNPEAARLAGIPVKRTRLIIFIMQGAVAGLAGVILASRMTTGQPNTSEGLELRVISACVLGGVSLTGGVGGIVGVILGVLLMGTVENAMKLKNVDPFYQYIANGSILLFAVLLDRLQTRRSN